MGGEVGGWSEAHSFARWPSGGDFVVPGSVDYQELHRDGGDVVDDPGTGLAVHTGKPVAGSKGSRWGSAQWMLRGADFREGPCPKLNVNFPMELSPGSAVGHSKSNGAT